MYSCEAEHSHELSFPQGAHFSNGEQRQKRPTLNNMLQLTNYCSAGEPTTCLLVKDYWPVYIEHLFCIGSTQQEVG